MALYWCDSQYGHSCIRNDDHHAQSLNCQACDAVLCLPAGRRHGKTGVTPAITNPVTAKRWLQPEPHDSCPMFVGAWGVNHFKDCAWVKWNHARLAAKTDKSDGALDKQNKTNDVKATDTNPLAHVHTFIRVSNSHDPICDTHQCVACGAQRGTCQFCLGRGVWKPLYTHSP